MATTYITPVRAVKGKSAQCVFEQSLDYAMNPKKTRNGELTSGYECEPQTVAIDFLLTKVEYFFATGKEPKKDILMYHIRQAFKPGEVSPEDANRIGYELAKQFTKGKHAYVVATHEDTNHVHNHIFVSAVNIDCDRKFRDYFRSGRVLRRLSDIICLENGLSVIENPKPSKGHYGKWLGENKEPSQRKQLEQIIDKVLVQKPDTYEDFVKLLEDEGCNYKQSRNSVKLPTGKGFIRLNSLSNDYTETAIRERIDGKRTAKLRENVPEPSSPKFSLIIDLQNSIKAAHSVGYANWAKGFSLKEAAKTLLFLQDNKLDELGKLGEAAQKAKDDFNDLQTRIHAADARMKDITILQKHIGTYVKTKDIYARYKKSNFSKQFRAENEKALADHKTAKTYFDELKLDKLPTINMLKQEYATLAAEKKKLYGGYGKARSHMQELLMAQQNIKMFMGLHGKDLTKTQNRDSR